MRHECTALVGLKWSSLVRASSRELKMSECRLKLSASATISDSIAKVTQPFYAGIVRPLGGINK